VIEPEAAARFVEPLAHGGDVAEGATGGITRLAGRHAVGDQAVGLEVEVGADFVVEVARVTASRSHAAAPL
jgi:hypothetical protein